MRILVTGGSGFIGTNLAAHLANEGHDVTVFDLRESNAHGCAWLDGDITQADGIAEAAEGMDAIVHLAAQVSPQRSIDDPAETAEVNVQGSLNILEAAKAAGCRKVVLASSAAVYGRMPTTPTTETEPLKPLTPYAESKIRMEALAGKYAQEGLATVCLRFFNVYGPWQDPDSQYAAAIPAFITRALAGETVTIHGDGKQTRDFIYVADVCKAIELALEHGEGVVNIATGHETTIKELAETIIAITGSASAIEHSAPRKGDPRTSVADVTKAKRELGFSAATTLRDGLQKTIDFFRNQA